MTPWFCALTHPPVRVGWYECRNSSDIADTAFRFLRYWNGTNWLLNGPRTRRVAFGTWTAKNQWRGLFAHEARRGS